MHAVAYSLLPKVCCTQISVHCNIRPLLVKIVDVVLFAECEMTGRGIFVLNTEACFLLHMHYCNIYIYKQKASKKHFDPIECTQCPEFSTIPAVFFSGMTPTEEDCRCGRKLWTLCAFYWNAFCFCTYLLLSNTQNFVNHLSCFT